MPAITIKKSKLGNHYVEVGGRYRDIKEFLFIMSVSNDIVYSSKGHPFNYSISNPLDLRKKDKILDVKFFSNTGCGDIGIFKGLVEDLVVFADIHEIVLIEV